MVMLVRLEHALKALSPMDVTEGGSMIVLRLVQSLNAWHSIDWTEGEMMMLVRLKHPLNAPSLIDVTEGGSMIVLRLVQSLNALS